MKFSKLSFISLILLLIVNSESNSYTHSFENKTTEPVDVEISLDGAKNRVAERIMPGETRQIETFGIHCNSGINIWRTSYPRDYTGLIGTWKYSRSYDPVVGGLTGDITEAGAPCAGSNWVLSNEQSPLKNAKKWEEIHSKLFENNQALIKQGPGYYLRHEGKHGGIFYQGSNAAWTQKHSGLA